MVIDYVRVQDWLSGWDGGDLGGICSGSRHMRSAGHSQDSWTISS